MSSPPVASVVIPCFNGAGVLERAVSSVGSSPDVEIVVVDDGSTDGSGQVARGIGDPRVVVVTQSNKGLPAARNAGIAAARADLIHFLDADDELMSGALDHYLTEFRVHPSLGMLAAGNLVVSETGHPLALNQSWLKGSMSFTDWLVSCPIVPSAVMVRREWITRVDAFDEGQRFVEDWDLWLRLSAAGCPMRCLRTALVRHFISSGGMSKQGIEMRDGTLRALEKAITGSVVDETTARLARSRAHLQVACRLFAAHEAELARADLRSALELDPTLVEGAWPRAADRFADWAANPIESDPIAFVEYVSEHATEYPALAAVRRPLLERAVAGRAWKSMQVDQPGDASEWLGKLWAALPALAEDASSVATDLVRFARRTSGDLAPRFVERTFDSVRPPSEAWSRERSHALGLSSMLAAVEARRSGQGRLALRPAIAAAAADPRLIRNRGLQAAVGSGVKHYALLPQRTVRLIRKLPRRSRTDLFRSAIWTLRTGEPVLITRGTRILAEAGAIDVAVRGHLVVGFRDISPSRGAVIEVEPGGHLSIDGGVEVMHGAWLRVKPTGHLAVGGATYIMSEAIVWCRQSILIGKGCAISWRAQILDSDEHKLGSVASDPGPMAQPVLLGEHVWIGAGATVLKGVTVGDGAAVAAKAVVTRDIADETLVAGNPARVLRNSIRWR